MLSVPISIAKVNSKKANQQTNFNKKFVKTLGEVAFLIERYPWSPCVWTDGIRLMKNFMFCQFVVLDFDDGKTTIKLCHEQLSDIKIAHLIGTTKSHQKRKISGTKILPAVDRFRLVIPLNRSLCRESERYKYQMSHFMKLIPGADPACKDSARFYWPCTQIIHLEPGLKMSVPTAPSIVDISKQHDGLKRKDVRSGKSGVVHPETKAFLETGIAPGQRRPMVFKTAARLTRYGWDHNKIKESILNAPFDKTGIPTSDLLRQIANGIKAGMG